MPMDLLTGMDVDHDRFAESLRALADALDDGRAGTTDIVFNERVPGDGFAEFTLTVEYATEGGDERLTNPLEYAKENRENEG